jgi:hypothetical protein
MSYLKTAVGLIQANPQCYKPGNINEFYFDNNLIDNTGNDEFADMQIFSSSAVKTGYFDWQRQKLYFTNNIFINIK